MPACPKPRRKRIEKTPVKKKGPKRSRKALVRDADKWFSLYIRSVSKKLYGPMCPFCSEVESSQCFHFITRSKHSVRWDARNATASCSGCNYTMEFNPHPFVLWYLKRFGEEAYLTLVQDSNKRAGYSRHDLVSIAEKYKSLYETCEGIA